MEKFSEEWRAARNKLKKLAFAENKATIIEALKAANISHAYVEYSGDGDSGNGTEQYATENGSQIEVPAGGSIALKQLNYEVVPALEVKWHTLSEALDQLCYDAIEIAGHDGYENGSGGGGTMTIDVQEETLVLEHYDIIEERDESRHEF